jgi:hypothetical protein
MTVHNAADKCSTGFAISPQTELCLLVKACLSTVQNDNMQETLSSCTSSNARMHTDLLSHIKGSPVPDISLPI